LLLELQGISKCFGGLIALKDISLTVDQGQILGLIGPNGAGKTTLLNLISGSLRPDRGLIRYQGQEILRLGPDQRCRKGISRTFQISRPFPKMSVLENVIVAAIFGNPHQSHESPRALALSALRFVQFPVDEGVLAKNLNMAQLKRLDLARALASEPSLLLLDEIAAGLTPREWMDLMSLIRHIREQQITIIIVEHLMRMMLQLCDRIVVLHYGEKIAEGTPQEIRQNKNVAEAYLGENYLL
jgi:branched-chain amino acid transport system ATP-binding protein